MTRSSSSTNEEAPSGPSEPAEGSVKESIKGIFGF